jgi:hypothetical protein
MLTADVGLSGGGFFLGLFSIGSISIVFGSLRAKAEAWLATIVIYAFLIFMTLAYGSYLLMALDVFIVVFTFLVKDAFGIRFKKVGMVEEVKDIPSVTQLDKKAVAKLSKKVGMEVKNVKCPKCSSKEIIIMNDASGVCKSCNVGIMDVRKIAKA